MTSLRQKILTLMKDGRERTACDIAFRLGVDIGIVENAMRGLSRTNDIANHVDRKFGKTVYRRPREVAK